jgi:uncharacterized protein YdeI (YjbR/CyaY-like superfamily)
MALTRALQPMPDDIAAVLRQRDLTPAYEARPAYQRNDYLAWIGRAQRPDTRQKRLTQMLDELAAGYGYMNMEWHPREA